MRFTSAEANNAGLIGPSKIAAFGLATIMSLTFRVKHAEQFLDLLLAEAGHFVVRVGQLLRPRLLPRGHCEHLRRSQARLTRPQLDVG